MMKMNTEEEMVVAVLHDAIEDSYDPTFTMTRIRRSFSAPVADALCSLTHAKGEPYRDYIIRVGNNPIAREVKIADLEDNLNTLRLQSLSGKDLERIQKYHNSIRYLLSLR